MPKLSKLPGPMYLITGATGEIGARVVELLLNRGDRVRVFVRNARKAQARYGGRVEVVAGDLADAASLRSALAGVDALLIINSGQDIPARDREAAKAAKAAGVKHLVKLSSMDAQQGFGTGAWHAQGEAAIRACRVAFTFVEPSGFMSNALGWAISIKKEGVVRACTGEGGIAFVHPSDVSAVTTTALTTRDYDGQSIAITGPEALSYAEMTAKIGAAIGRPLTFQPISEGQERQRMITSGALETEIEAHLSIYRAIREGRASAVTNNVERVLARNPLTFDQWAKENAAAFR